MGANVQKRGEYELFETTKNHRILALNGREWYALVEGQQSPLIVKSDSNHEKQRTLAEGRFYLIDFEDDPDFRDVPHLFLLQDGEYRELILPNGLPTDHDHQKRLVETDETISPNKLRTYVA
ncbi:MAG TPA: hypothetical protein VMM78_13710 [Thermomicrobiales bacterium]|nr:hypothetical protein [Thermomicrobiales bacterium]